MSMTDNSKFRDELLSLIDSAGTKQQDDTQKSIRLQCEEKLEQARAEGERRYTELVTAAKRNMDASEGSDAAKKKQETRIVAGHHREKIKQAVYDDVLLKISNFVNSHDYEEYLGKVCDCIVGKCAPCKATVYIRPADEKYSEIFSGSGLDVRTDASIKLGSVYAVCDEKRLRFDDTFDKKLEDEMEKFTINSGLVI